MVLRRVPGPQIPVTRTKSPLAAGGLLFARRSNSISNDPETSTQIGRLGDVGRITTCPVRSNGLPLSRAAQASVTALTDVSGVCFDAIAGRQNDKTSIPDIANGLTVSIIAFSNFLRDTHIFMSIYEGWLICYNR